MAKRGRPPLSIQEHLKRGTYRADRHGPLPRVAGKGPMGPTGPAIGHTHVPNPMAPIGDTAGARFAAAVVNEWKVDDALGRQLAMAAGHALDRLQARDAQLEGPDGLLAKAAAGTVSAAHVDVVLKARKQAADDFRAALDRLDLEAVTPQMRVAQ